MAQAGIASRRKCEELIFEGKVKVNGKVVLQPQHGVDLAHDLVEVEGKKIKRFEKKVYYLLNKPLGYVCSHNKEVHKKIILDLLPNKERLFTVGRLDKDTMGLLIVTNDGQLAERISHPRYEVEKEYLVKTDREILDTDLKKISSGVRIDKVLVCPLSVRKVRKGTLKIVIKEGKKHEVRKLVEQTGLVIHELIRIRIANLPSWPNGNGFIQTGRP